MTQNPDQLSPSIKENLEKAFHNDVSPEQHDKNMALLKAQTDLKRDETQYWEEKFPWWSSLADQVRRVQQGATLFLNGGQIAVYFASLMVLQGAGHWQSGAAGCTSAAHNSWFWAPLACLTTCL